MKQSSKILYLVPNGHELTIRSSAAGQLLPADKFRGLLSHTLMTKIFFFMKYTLLTCLLVMALSVNSFAQVQADPGVSGFEITDNLLVPQNANQLYQNANYHLRIPIFNSNQINPLPAGSCKLRIGLGSKTVPINTAVPSTSFNTYFTWTAVFTGGQWQVTGDLTANLPPDFNGTIDIPVTPTIQGSSTYTANFLVTNHANSPPNILSDEDPTNNGATLSYTVIPPAPVKFTALDLLKSGCSIKVSFNTEEELNVNNYEIEVSKDGYSFVKVASVQAKNTHTYKTDFVITDAIRADKIFVRVKSVDKDGNVLFSSIKPVSGICGQALQMQVYPNPVTDTKAVINATQGLFNGRYKVSVRDFAGKLVAVKEVDLQNVARFDCELGNIASGKYIIQVANTDGSESAVLQLQKL